MRVQSPVGTFPVRLTGAKLHRGVPRVQMAMGAWHSEVTLDRADLPVAAAAMATIAGIFLLGRSLANRH